MRGARFLAVLLLLSACGDDGPAAFDDASPGDAPVVSECDELTGPGTMHSGTISADETWTAAGSPHHVTATVRVYGAALTIEPCATVRFADPARLTIGDSSSPGELIALGTETRPISFEPEDPAARFGGIEVNPRGTADLTYVTLSRASSRLDFNQPAALVIRGDDNQTAPVPQVRAQAVRIIDPGAMGVYAIAAGGFTADSADLTITGAGSDPYAESRFDNRQPVFAEPLSMQTLPSGTYTGNVTDTLYVQIRPSVQGNLHLRNHGLPYLFSAGLLMYSPEGQTTTLTLDAGVVLRMAANGGIKLDSLGATGGVRIVANGTAAAPVTITSSKPTPAPGDWIAIDWAAGASTGNVLNNLVVEFGGAESGTSGNGCGPTDNDALLIIKDWVPAAGMIQNSVFRNSLEGGIVSGWTDAGQGPNLSLTNTFTGISNGCAVTRPSAGSYCASDTMPQCFVN